VLTERLELRLPTEADRARFVQLFCDESFMIFSSGVLTADAAHERFDRMLSNAIHLSFAKQPIIERSTGETLGYCGVDWFDLEGDQRLEFGYRLVAEARGLGYATEASRAVLERATGTYQGEVLALIHPDNEASRNVARQLGFAFWRPVTIDSGRRDLLRIRIDRVPPTS
jgi:RimJ/RimL family protein N-acetyltransferase